MRSKEEIFNDIYRRFYNEIANYTWRHLYSRELLEDILQETFRDIYINLDILLMSDNHNAWIYGCLKNHLKETLRKESKHINNSIPFETLTEENETDGTDFVEGLVIKESLIRSLGEKDYNVLHKQYIEGYSTLELANELQKTEGQYRMRVSRLKKKVTELLRENGFEKY